MEFSAIATEEYLIAEVKDVNAQDPAIAVQEARLAARKNAVRRCERELLAHQVILNRDMAKSAEESAAARQIRQEAMELEKKEEVLKNNKVSPPTKAEDDK
jgi:hypothetical protein